MDHGFIWDTLRIGGLPGEFINAIKALYTDNRHIIRMGNADYQGPEVHSGVRQGCPLSGLLFALCADVLLSKLGRLLTRDEVVRAFADDTAAVIDDYAKHLPMIAKIFEEYRQISGLQLNIKKTVFIPLWKASSIEQLRTLIKELCPGWEHIKIDSQGKYLGFIIGPGSGERSWCSPLAKYNQRIEKWKDVHCGLFLNTVYYNTFASTVLSYVAQLEDVSTDIVEAEEAAMRKLAVGPGTWVTMDDCENLGTYGVGQGFRLIEATAKAAKLRVLEELGVLRIKKLYMELISAHSSVFHRPFGQWHYKSYVQTLCTNAELLKEKGITMAALRQKEPLKLKIQGVAREHIDKILRPYSAESRIREKILRWQFSIPSGIATARMLKVIELLKERAKPAVRASFFRALWNGWPTSRRMRTMKNAAPAIHCVFGCSEEDSLEHYSLCSVVWKFLSTPAPEGMGIPREWKSRDAFFAIFTGMGDEEKLRAATGLHVVAKMATLCKTTAIGKECDLQKMFQLQLTTCNMSPIQRPHRKRNMHTNNDRQTGDSTVAGEQPGDRRRATQAPGRSTSPPLRNGFQEFMNV